MTILDTIEAAAQLPGSPRPLKLVAPDKPRQHDLILKPTHLWWDAKRLEAVIASLNARKLVTSAVVTGNGLELRLSDRLLVSSFDVLGTSAPLQSSQTRTVVQFGDPNTTKALHLGHLRNVAIGNAIASMIETAGSPVVRQSVVCDFGRAMTEAMIGCTTYPELSWLLDGQPKSDHVVGECYARYVGESLTASNEVGPADRPVAREVFDHNDRAEDALRKWLDSDSAMWRLWTSIRNLVLNGHMKTLAKMGVRVERYVFESEWRSLIGAIVSEGLACGLFRESAEGDVVYPTGLEEQAELTLMRSGGFPTVHLRTLAVWVGLDPGLSDTNVILVGGDEWLLHDTCIENMLCEVLGSKRCCPTPIHVQYGMVRTNGVAIKSSEGTTELIDEILEVAIERLSVRYPNLSLKRVESFAASTLLGFFLGYPVREKLDIDSDAIFDPSRNAGLAVLTAWDRAAHRLLTRDHRRALDAGATECRWAIVQANLAERVMRDATASLDPYVAMKFYTYLANWYLSEPHGESVDSVIFTTLRVALVNLGLAKDAWWTEVLSLNPAELDAGSTLEGAYSPC
jgi:arginyl-tRNA synthetase